MKQCTHPEHAGVNPLPLSAFGKNRKAPDGLAYWCRACRVEDARRRRAANPEGHRESVSRWQRANPEKRRAKNRRWRMANPEKERDREQRQRQALYDAVFGHYGRTCACPGCGATEHLTIDHIEGGGTQHRIELFGRARGASKRLYRWLIANGFPEGFQPLCRSCNSSKGTGPACQIDHARKAA